jgi:hypothetical protein
MFLTLECNVLHNSLIQLRMGNTSSSESPKELQYLHYILDQDHGDFLKDKVIKGVHPVDEGRKLVNSKLVISSKQLNLTDIFPRGERVWNRRNGDWDEEGIVNRSNTFHISVISGPLYPGQRDYHPRRFYHISTDSRYRALRNWSSNYASKSFKVNGAKISNTTVKIEGVTFYAVAEDANQVTFECYGLLLEEQDIEDRIAECEEALAESKKDLERSGEEGALRIPGAQFEKTMQSLQNSLRDFRDQLHTRLTKSHGPSFKVPKGKWTLVAGSTWVMVALR